MRNPDRLSGLDSSFLYLERDATPMHVAACAVFTGPAPSYDELVAHIVSRLHLVPRYRQRLAFVPLGQGRPVWVDDPHFRISYHVRDTALPRPGGDEELRRMAARVFSQALDRARPLWELWRVEGLSGGRYAVLSKTHHALVDGISGVDIMTVLFDTSPEPVPVAGEEEEWIPKPLPSSAQLLGSALLERLTAPRELLGGTEAALHAPLRLAGRAVKTLGALSAIARVGAHAVPSSPFNVRIGPHRRFSWVESELEDIKHVKNVLGGTVNDVVLAAVAGALGRYMRVHGFETDGVELTALVPVSTRAEVERGALGNRVAAVWAPLPVGTMDPVARLARIAYAMAGLKESGQAVGAHLLTEFAGFAPPTIVDQASRLQTHQRLFNLVVTNVPGPQAPLYLLGRELDAVYPLVPLVENTALGIAVMSYNGRLYFGLTSDYDALPDLEALATDLRDAIDELLASAGGPPPGQRRADAPLPLSEPGVVSAPD